MYGFKKKNNIVSVSLEERQTLISRRIEKINDALTEVSIKRMEQAAQRKQILAAKKVDPLEIVAGPVMKSLTVQSLKSVYVKEYSKYQALRQRYLDRHPLVLEQKATLDAARTDMKREIENELRAMETRFRSIKDNEVQLAAALQRSKDEALSLNKREVDYLRLKRTQENTAKLYSLVLTRMKESDLSAQLRVSNMRMLDRAVVPAAPVRPRVHLNLLIGALLGLLLGIGLAFLIDTLDSSVKSQEDVEQVPALTFLGLMPRIPGSAPSRKGKRPDPTPELDLVVHHSSKSAVAEACRAIRTNVMFTSADQKLKTIVVTSAAPGTASESLGGARGCAGQVRVS